MVKKQVKRVPGSKGKKPDKGKVKLPKEPRITEYELERILDIKSDMKSRGEKGAGKMMNKELMRLKSKRTGKTYKTLSNLVSEVTSDTKRGDAGREKAREGIKKYKKKVEMYEEFKNKDNRIPRESAESKDIHGFPIFKKVSKKAIDGFINRTKGDQLRLEIGYLAETDEYYVHTP